MKKTKMFFFMMLTMIFAISLPLISAVSYGWGYQKNKTHTVPDVGFYEKEIQDTNSHYVDKLHKSHIYLTFDAGYDNGVLSKILDVLKEKEVKSTFFITGDFITREKELVLRIVEEGHLIGNHTWGHKDITTLSKEELQSELGRLEEAYYDLTNQKMMKIFRPPAGKFNREALQRLKELGYHTFFWSIAYKDWIVGEQRGNGYAYQSVMEQLHDGAIILMHTVSTDNQESLGKIIDDIRAKNYVIKNVDELV